MPQLDLTPDQLLTTTRTVRKRLDLSRPVELEVVRECIEIATQAPTAGNAQHWHFVVVTEPEKKREIADFYRRSFQAYIAHVLAQVDHTSSPDAAYLHTMQRIGESSLYLAEHLHEVPVFVLPCLEGRIEKVAPELQAGFWGSILPAVWSFVLAARIRALGTAWTTMHLMYEKEVGQILGIPTEKFTQVALLPVAYTIGSVFKAAPRKSLDQVIHVDTW